MSTNIGKHTQTRGIRRDIITLHIVSTESSGMGVEISYSSTYTSFIKFLSGNVTAHSGTEVGTS